MAEGKRWFVGLMVAQEGGDTRPNAYSWAASIYPYIYINDQHVRYKCTHGYNDDAMNTVKHIFPDQSTNLSYNIIYYII